jgi:hypothetical protein
METIFRAEKPNEQVEDKKRSKSSQLFVEIANSTSRAAGRAPTFVAALAVVLIWAITGPVIWLFRHLAACHQHRHHHHHVPDGLLDPKLSKPGRRSPTSQIG